MESPRFIIYLLGCLGATSGYAQPIACPLLYTQVAGPTTQPTLSTLPETEQNLLIVHTVGRNFLPASLTEKAVITSEGVTPRGIDNPNLGWIRDRFPFQTRDPHGRPVMNSYLSFLNKEGHPYDGGSTYANVAIPAGLSPKSRLFRTKDKPVWMEVNELPLIIEGGNISQTAEHLLVGEKVFNENSRSLAEIRAFHSEVGRGDLDPILAGFEANGYKPRSRAEVLQLLSDATGVRLENILVMPWMPGESTGHLDMYVGLLDPRTVVVPRIPDYVIDGMTLEHEKKFARQLNSWLDQRSEDFAKNTSSKIEVLRPPMLAPRNLSPSGVSPFGYDAQFPSTANFVVQDGKAYVPAFPNFANAVGADVGAKLQAEIREQFAKRNLTVEFVDSEALLQYNGLLHCLTAKVALP